MKMKRLLVNAALAIYVAAVASLAALAHAQPVPLRVLCSNGMRAVVEQLKPELERAAGQPLAIEFGTSADVRKKIESGAPFDVAVLTVEVIDGLAKGGKVVPESVGALGRSAVGVGVRAGAPLPDLKTPDAVK